MASKWYRLVASAFRTLYYRRIAVVSTKEATTECPTLYVALHRNGAIDGYVYMHHVPHAYFMLASQLKRNAFIRVFFDGIEVTRDKDGGDQSGNSTSLAACTQLLGLDEPLLVFPEGTSNLGFRHLPFKKGAARIAEAFVETGRSLRIVPLALHYQAGWAWQSDVDLVVGPSFEIPGETLVSVPVRARRRLNIHQRVTQALEAIGIDAPDAATFANWERLSCAASIATPITYTKALKIMEEQPKEAQRLGAMLDDLIREHHPCLYQGVPLTAPCRPKLLLHFILSAPIALAMIGLNAPVLALSLWAGRRFADDRNVIAFWRFVVGAPLFAIWAIGMTVAIFTVGAPALFAVWTTVSVAGLRALWRVRKLAVQLVNAFLYPKMSAELTVFQRQLSRLVNDPERD